MNDRDRAVSDAAAREALRATLDEGREAVLATVVSVEGRAYRRPGARMVVDPDGDSRGQVTAGCLEDRVADLAADVLAADAPRVETYDLRADDDVWGLGVGCAGVVSVLLEPVDGRHAPLVGDRPVATAVVLDGDPPTGARAHWRGGEAARDEDFPAWLADAVADAARDLAAEGGADTVALETDAGRARAFLAGVRPPPRLLVCGAGHDAGPVVDLASENGFRVTVAGFRGGVDLAERFPRAERTVATAPADLRDAAGVDGETYAVVMSHNFVDDRLAVEELLASPAPYVGLMGPRERFAAMRQDLGVDPDEAEALYTPVGLDLGAGSPYGVATSVVAEVLAVRNDRDPGHLADRAAPIHDRTVVGDGDGD